MSRNLIIIRGPPGSGKKKLANLILREEKRLGNNQCVVLDSTDQDELVYKVRDCINQESIRLIIAIVKGGRLLHFNKICHIAKMHSNLWLYGCYVIVIHQPRDVCIKFSANQRSSSEIDETIRDLANFHIPVDVAFLDPKSFLLENCRDEYEIPAQESSQPSANQAGDVSNQFESLNTLACNRNVMDIVMKNMRRISPLMSKIVDCPNNSTFGASSENVAFHSGTFQSLPKNYVPKNYFTEDNSDHTDVPTFVPSKITDYQHAHKPTLEELLSEFRICRSFNYDHKSSSELRMHLEDVDVDKIVKKRRKVALRKKILYYLKTATRPEDTVSNPKYPNNWEKIQLETPLRKNKRSKKSFKSIAKKKHEQCYYEDISSDENF
jgi:hypothetical protein